ncbi:hypothetical protein H650_18310 [Enterobacter sp. R4-368]|nr:hypothetical protein H650_18310 [Enterobacter sp. R4-368]
MTISIVLDTDNPDTSDLLALIIKDGNKAAPQRDTDMPLVELKLLSC